LVWPNLRQEDLVSYLYLSGLNDFGEDAAVVLEQFGKFVVYFGEMAAEGAGLADLEQGTAYAQAGPYGKIVGVIVYEQVLSQRAVGHLDVISLRQGIAVGGGDQDGAVYVRVVMLVSDNAFFIDQDILFWKRGFALCGGDEECEHFACICFQNGYPRCLMAVFYHKMKKSDRCDDKNADVYLIVRQSALPIKISFIFLINL